LLQFQSAPANYGGRILQSSLDRVPLVEVSIRARQLRRANPTLARGLMPGFWFQSAPANYGGRIRMEIRNDTAMVGFNPRPPITAGESSTQIGDPSGGGVSIRAGVGA